MINQNGAYEEERGMEEFAVDQCTDDKNYYSLLPGANLFGTPHFWVVAVAAIGLIIGTYLLHGSISIMVLFIVFTVGLMFFVYHDMIKRLKKVADRNRELEAKAREAEVSSRCKSLFLANISHELRTPLNSIILLSQLLSENKENNLTDKQVEYTRCVQSSGHDLLQLINDILDLSKIESGKIELHIEEISLEEIATSIMRNFNPVAEKKRLGFHVIKEANLPEIMLSDRQRIEQILRNLLSNAFKFTSNGQITLRISRPDIKTDLSGSRLKHNQCISFSVTDTGIGIPVDKINLIFEVFQQGDGTTSREYGGTGLGLSISKELAKLLKGEIQAVSVEGEGSTFSLYVPESLEYTPADNDVMNGLKKDTPPPETQEPLAIQVIDDKDVVKGNVQNDKILLLIEEDPLFIKMFTDISKTKGFRTIIAQNGESVLNHSCRDNPKAIVLGINPKGINGWDILSRLKDDLRTRHTPVYMVSSSDSKREAMRMGAVGCISKPVDKEKIEKLFSHMEEILGKVEKKLLVIEDNEVTKKLIERLFDGMGIVITYVSTGKEAIEKLSLIQFDCVVLDLSLPDMSGFDILSRIKNNESPFSSPIIVYTGKRLSAHERAVLDEYTESIVVKGVNSPAKLLDEATLFLHINEAVLPEERKKMLFMLHNKEAIIKGKKILIADDDMRNLFVLTNLLESNGVNVINAKNGREVLNSLTENPDIDLIIMDMMMPEMDGYMAIKEIRKQNAFAELPVIALTARAMNDDRTKCIKAGASDYLSKPFEKDRLFTMLRAWLY
jgi:signal transduction histidine kinase/CheY-like chemotaxis protein